jgi:hypothetical protein
MNSAQPNDVTRPPTRPVYWENSNQPTYNSALLDTSLASLLITCLTYARGSQRHADGARYRHEQVNRQEEEQTAQIIIESVSES